MLGLLGALPVHAAPPSRLRLTVPAAPVAPGQAAHLKIELVGEDRKPAATLRERTVRLAGAGPLAAPVTVTIPAGASEVEVPVASPKPGLWQVEVTSPGLSPDVGVVVSLGKAAERPRVAPERAHAAAAERPKPGGPPPAPIHAAPPPASKTLPERHTFRVEARRPASSFRLPAPQAGAERSRVTAEVVPPAPGSAPGPSPEPPPPPPSAPAPAPAPVADAGHVELIAQPVKVRRGPQGWESSRVRAYWFHDEAPVPAARDLQLSLVLSGGSGNTGLAPLLLAIPKGAFMSPAEAQISAQGADTAAVKALYDGGVSKTVEVDFLPTVPTRLGFEGPPEVVRGLATVTSDLFVRLLDDDLRPVAADEAVPVTVTIQGPAETVSQSVSIPAGAIEAKVPLELSRQGVYSVGALAPGLAPAAAYAVTYAIDWLLIALALLGGVLGSMTRVLYRHERGRGPMRVLFLGVLAAFLTLLLFSFGLLALLEGALPEALAKLPSHGPFAALLLGFLAGLSFDKVFGRFLSGAEPAPAPAPAPATDRKGRPK